MFSLRSLKWSGFARFAIMLLALGAASCHAQAEEPNKRIKDLIAKLNAPDTIDREDAERELMGIGQPALPSLRDASADPQPEIAARAKKLVTRMAQSEGKPLASYAELFPANSVFFAESPDSKGALERLKTSPLGKFWDLEDSQKSYKQHYDAQMDNDRRLLDSIANLFKLADGRALFALGSPDSAEATELDPPLVYALESKDAHELELQVRALLQSMNDPPRSIRRYGPFSVEEQTSAQTIFNQEGMVHALTEGAINAFLDTYTKKPDDPLTRELTQIRKLAPNYDLLIHMKHSGLDLLSDAGQLVDDDIIRTLNTYGFVEGSTFQTALTLNADGILERGRLVLSAKEKNTGLLAVVKAMTVTPPADAKAPQALDLIPWQAAMLISFQGDIGKDSDAVSKALRAIDAAGAVENQDIKPKPPDAKEHEKKEHEKKDKKDLTKLDAPKNVAPPPPSPDKPKTRAEEALAAGGGLEKKPDEPKADPAKDEPKISYPHIQKFERIGLKLEQFLAQIDGPVHLALFLNNIGEELPEEVPITPLYAVLLKDPRAIEQALDAQAAGDKPRYAKELLNGGFHYVEVDGGVERPGYWLKGNYLAYSSYRDVLEMASKALMHENGNERMADRPSYKQELASTRHDAQAVLSVFGDADQVLETPYKLAALAWKPDPGLSYPDYSVVKPLLLNKPVSIHFKTVQDVLEFTAQTPLSLLGLIEAFRLPIKEAGL
jgi:hypothetical protein